VNFTRDDQFAQVVVYDATLKLYMPQFLDIKIDYRDSLVDFNHNP
jgi:hypothetical protein